MQNSHIKNGRISFDVHSQVKSLHVSVLRILIRTKCLCCIEFVIL